MQQHRLYKAISAVIALFFILAVLVLMGNIALDRAGLSLFERFEALFDNDPFDADAIKDPPFESLSYGVQAFLWWYDDVAALHLEWVRLLSFTHIKQTFAWKDIQPERDVWHWQHGDRVVDMVEAKGLHLVARLGVVPNWAHPTLEPRENADYSDAPPANLDDWAAFCGAVAGRYRGRIKAYQIWNEPNLSREWGNQAPDAAAYVELLRVCSEAIRAADPEAIIISAGLAPTGQHDDLAHRDDMYLQAMYDAGFQRYADVVGVHAPGYTVPEYGPDDAEREGYGRWQTFRRVEDLRKVMLKNGDAARQMAILEVGYTTDTVHPEYIWFAVDQWRQAKLMERAYAYAAEHWRPRVGLMSSIYIADPDWTAENEEYWWAFNVPDEDRMRPVFGRLAQMEKFCGDDYLPPRSPEESAFALEHNPCN